MPMSDKEACQQLEELMKDMRQWVSSSMKKEPDRARRIRTSLTYLAITVRQHPEQAKAVMYMANALWDMLCEEAHIGVGVRHKRKTEPYYGEVGRDDVVKALNAIRREEPGISKTKAVPKIAKRLECSQRTVWNKLKE